MMPPKRHKQEENVDNWLMSYADMITLLLAFFVIFISVSEPKTEKMYAITESMSGQFGTVDLATPFQGTYTTLLAVVEEQRLLKDVAVERTQNGIGIEMATHAFFRPDSVEFDPSKTDALAQIIAAVRNIDFLSYRIAIEAHTSDEPVKNANYPSNWELSTAQAAAMARYFISQGIEENRLKVVGYAGSKPKVPNLDLQGKPIYENRKENQRIVLRIERDL